DDARVYVGGSTGNKFHASFHGGNLDELRFEAYSPPYLFSGPRPEIESAAPLMWLNSTYAIGTSFQEDHIAAVSLVRASSTTHQRNTDQRMIRLPIVSKMAGIVTVATPFDSSIAPPGRYMLFLMSDQGVPSLAKFVTI